MEFDAGTQAGSGQIENSRRKVLAIEFHARESNTGIVSFGRSDVGQTNGRSLAASESTALSFSDAGVQGSVDFRFFFVNVPTSGDRIDWTVIIL